MQTYEALDGNKIDRYLNQIKRHIQMSKTVNNKCYLRYLKI